MYHYIKIYSWNQPFSFGPRAASPYRFKPGENQVQISGFGVELSRYISKLG